MRDNRTYISKTLTYKYDAGFGFKKSNLGKFVVPEAYKL